MRNLYTLLAGLCITGILLIGTVSCNGDQTDDDYECRFSMPVYDCAVCVYFEAKSSTEAQDRCLGIAESYSAPVTDVPDGECARQAVCKVLDCSNGITSYWNINPDACVELNGSQDGCLTATYLPADYNSD